MTDPLTRPCGTYALGLLQAISGPRADLLPADVRDDVAGLCREALRREATCGALRDALMETGVMSRFLAAVQEADFAMKNAKRRNGRWVRPASSYPVEV